MNNQQSLTTDNTQQRERDEAIRHQQEVSDNLVGQQKEVSDELSRKAIQEQLDREQAWAKEKAGENQLMPAQSSGLPQAPREPLPVQGSAQDKAQGQQALQAYKDTGFLASSEGVPLVGGPQATGGDQALAEEKEFRERQQQLADRITDPNTSHEQRERFELVKAALFHDHKAAQWENVAQLQQSLGYPPKSVQEAANNVAHHKEQSELVANKLYQDDQSKNLVPKQVQARMGQSAQPNIQHNTQNQISSLPDPHLQTLASAQAQEAKQSEQKTKLANPAHERAQQRREDALRAHTGEKPSPYVQTQLAEANGRELQIEASKAEQHAETHKRKTEAEYQHG